MLSFDFETEDGTVITGPILFREAVRGIPNRATPLYARNVGDEIFEGEIYVSPGDGQSYSEDLLLAPMVGGLRLWSRSFSTTIDVQERVGLYVRVNPITTPSNTTGSANILFSRS